MDINKVIFKGVKVAFIIMFVLLIVYGIMKASFFAYDFGYNLAIESLMDKTADTESTGE